MLPIIELDHHPVFPNPKHHHSPPANSPDIGKEVIETFGDRIQQQRGWDIPDDPVVLGRGTRGTTYALDSKVALKLTTDESEALASEKIRETPVDKVVEIYDVFSLAGTQYFCIVQERLQPLEPPLAAELKKIFTNFDLGDYLQGNGYDPDAVIKMAEADVAEMHDHGDFAKARALNDQLNRLKELGLFDMARELKKAGIQFHDYHDGNLMLRGKELVVIDLGKSRVAGGKKPGVVENWKMQMEWRSRLMKLISR
jgi:hypothetical protein